MGMAPGRWHKTPLEEEATLTATGILARSRTLIKEGRLGDYAAALAVRALEVVGKFGLYLFAARLLGGYQSGLLFFCITWVNLASAAARMGMERSLTRHIAGEIAVGRGTAARAALLSGMGYCAIGALSWAAITAVAAGPAARYVFGQPDLAWPLMVSALLLIPQTLAVALGFALTGIKRGALGQLVYSALPPLIALALILLGVERLDHVILGYAGGYVITALIALAALLRDRHKFTDRPELEPIGQAPAPLPPLWTTARPFLAIEMISVALTSLPLLVLGAFADPVQVGAFSIASRLSSLVWMIIVSIGGIASPRFAEHHRRGEAERLAAVNRLVRRLTWALCTPPLLLMLLVPTALLTLIGADFGIGARALVIMSVGQLINCYFSQQDCVLGMTGHGKTLRMISMLQLALGIMVGAVCIPLLGSEGAAITTAVCMAFGALAATICARFLVPESV